MIITQEKKGRVFGCVFNEWDVRQQPWLSGYHCRCVWVWRDRRSWIVDHGPALTWCRSEVLCECMCWGDQWRASILTGSNWKTAEGVEIEEKKILTQILEHPVWKKVTPIKHLEHLIQPSSVSLSSCLPCFDWTLSSTSSPLFASLSGLAWVDALSGWLRLYI